MAIPHELLCYDDGSTQSIKQGHTHLATRPHVTYTELTHNHGRAKIRNKLAQDAQYDVLLFLDGDSGIIKEDFIASYSDYLDKMVVNGGRIYSASPPEDATRYLHWKYGTENESRSLRERTASPVRYFHSNNFIIRRDLCLDVGFDESIAGYGYEDIAFAEGLRERGISVKHIDNQVEHLDLQSSRLFLDKAKKAIDNLMKLEQRDIVSDTNLQQAARKLSRWHMTGLFLLYYSMRAKAIDENLLSRKPSLQNLAFYKLAYYLDLKG